MKDYYKLVLGFEPYSYQEKVADLLLSGRNIILSVPTGAGKTWASVMPFLYAQHNGRNDFPQKMIYSLPLRTLANSIYSDVTETLKKSDLFKGEASIHTGEYENDEHFEKDIIFSTIDQTLSSFLCFPLSLSKRQANINAGALVGSYLVFDEFHLLDPKLSMATTIGMLKTLKNLCRFCIMTATLSEDYIKKLSKELNAEVVSIGCFSEDEDRISSLKVPEGHSVKKTVHVMESTISVSSILKRHRKKTIVICNRVEKAQQLYNDIVSSDHKGVDETNIICLHSRFFDEDRKKKEAGLKRLFGKENKESAILISTQVIEAGMDISCDTMHVEISPVNSILQRAGRCARWEKDTGKIYVYDILELEEHEKLGIETTNEEEEKQKRAINNRYLPYDKGLCKITFEKLKRVIALDKNVSQRLVDEILTDEELLSYSLISQDDFNRTKIQESWETCNKNMYSQTIRDIQSIEVAIIDYATEQRGAFIPYKYQSIGLYKWSFIKWAREILNERDFDFDNDVIFIARENSESTLIDCDTNDLDMYYLEAVRNIEPLKNCYDIVFVDKSIFKYTSDAGLEMGAGNTCSPLKPYIKGNKEIIEYKKDTFWQHNKALIGCYIEEFEPKLKFVIQQLKKKWGETIDWDKLIKAMICLHDYGKLNREWQKRMKLLQKEKSEQDSRFIYRPNEVLAHCDFNKLTDKGIEQNSGARKKPPHAGAGALAFIGVAENVIDSEDYGDLANCVSTAILKHHGVETETYSEFDIADEDYCEVEKLLRDIGINARLKKKARDGSLSDNLPENRDEWVIYFFLVRILRLCDQKATKDFEKYLKKCDYVF